MKLLKPLALMLLTILFLQACRNDDVDDSYKGEYSVTLIAKGDVSGTEGMEKDIVYDVVLSRATNSDLKLNFALEGDPSKDLVEVENPVVIAKNSTKGVLKIKIKNRMDAEKELTEDKNFAIVLKKSNYKLAKSYTIKVTKDEAFTPLTDAQKELLKYYKSQGLDLYQWIGKIPVEVKVITDHNGGFAPFDQKLTKDYTGVTYITLSDKATKDKPLLKMTKNALGLASYLEYVFMHETILNEEYWTNQPAPKKVLDFLGKDRVNKWKNKEYSFDVSVDELLFDKNGNITFVYENGANNTYTNFLTDERNSKISAIDFVYHFPLWDEFKELAKGNKELADAYEQGGSIHPNNYMPVSPILTDDWDDGSWVAPTANFNNTSGEMNFKFNVDHTNAGGYDMVTVKYKAQSKK